MKASRIDNQHALSLVESLVTLALLSFVLAVGINIFFNADKVSAEALHKKLAVEIANIRLEAIKKDGYAALESPLPSPMSTWTPASLPSEAWSPVPTWSPLTYSESETYLTESIVVGSLAAYQTVIVHDIDEDEPPDGVVDYKSVEVIVDWREADNPILQQVKLNTLIAP